MSRLDQMISDIGYIFDSLTALRNIHESGSCNDCKAALKCFYLPDIGKQVRYNCPFYKSGGTEAGNADASTIADFTSYLNTELPKRVYCGQPISELQMTVKKVAKQYIEEKLHE